VRDPWDVAETLHAAKICVPQLKRAWDSQPLGIEWLLKSTGSSGGLGVRLADAGLPPGSNPRRWYVQQRILGRSLGAVFVAATGAARLLGMTDQLVGVRWTGAPPFHYAGSIGPLRLAARARATIERIGSCLAAEYDLVGLFGVDFIRDRQGRFWPVDVNPRYPASTEVLELASGVSMIGLHARACTEREPPQTSPLTSRGYVGKAVVYAPGDFLVTKEQNQRWHASNNWPAAAFQTQSSPLIRSRYTVADIPGVGTHVPAGAPVVTLIERARDAATVRRRLRSRCVALRKRLQLSSLRTL
jgi:predicted ATP-grasp superfamily ATP-dependent carboligase